MNNALAVLYVFISAFFFSLLVTSRKADKPYSLLRRKSAQVGSEKEMLRFFVFGVLIQNIVFLSLLIFGARATVALTISAIAAILYPAAGILKRNRFRRHLDKEIEYLLVNLSSSLYINPSVIHAFREAAIDASVPMKREINRMLVMVESGASHTEALSLFARTLNDDVVKMAINGVSICSETGGNLADYLSRLAELKRSRRRITGKINSMSAQQKTTAKMVALIPAGFIGMIWLANRSFFSYFDSTIGYAVLGYSVISIAIGFLVMNKMTKLLPGYKGAK